MKNKSITRAHKEITIYY